MIDALYVHVVMAVYAASCCSHGRIIMKLHGVETLNIVHKHDTPPYLILLHSEAHKMITVSIYYHGINFNWEYEKPITNINF